MASLPTLDTQHAKILSIGDCDTEETRRYFEQHLLEDVPEPLRSRLPSFEEIYSAFGGKLAHWQDYISDFGVSIAALLLGRAHPVA